MQIPQFQFHNELKSLLPKTRSGIWKARIQIKPSGPDILNRMEQIISGFRSKYAVEDVSSIRAISENRSAYKILGKDPSRYRPSAEALCRRIAGGKSLFHVNNAVDILNTISIESGFSIGGYDMEKITGTIYMARGKENQPYDAIGRGNLNISGLPVLYDDLGPFGSPTSDSVRTMVTERTTWFLMVIFDFFGNPDLVKTLQRTSEDYREYAGVGDAESIIREF